MTMFDLPPFMFRAWTSEEPIRPASHMHPYVNPQKPLPNRHICCIRRHSICRQLNRDFTLPASDAGISTFA